MNLFRNQVRWLLIAWMFVISAVAYLDRVNLSIAGTAIEREFQIDHVRLGSVLSAFILGYAFFQAPGGRLADRFGPRRILLMGTLWWAVFTALTASIPANFRGALVTLITVRFLLGVGEAVVYPASNRLVASWIPSRERGLANGLIFAGVGAGAGVTPPLITYILLHHGWRWSFWISALIGLAAGIAAAGRSKTCPVEIHRHQQGCSRGHLELLLLWIRSLHFLLLVLYLSERRTRLESEVEFLLRDAAVSSHGNLLASRWVDQRCAVEAVGQSRRTLLRRISRNGALHCLRCDGNFRSGCALGQRGACRWRRRAVSFAKRVLVSYLGDGWQFSRFCFRCYEHGGADRRSCDSVADSADREAL